LAKTRTKWDHEESNTSRRLKAAPPTRGCVEASCHAARYVLSNDSDESNSNIAVPYGADHHRLLECRLWYFESVFDANDITTAESGFHGIAQRASAGSALFVEASFFIALCIFGRNEFRRQGRFRVVFEQLNTITSAQTRQLRQKRFVERIEQESC